MIKVNYQKRKNQELFKSLENPKTIFLSNSQNYIPIYKKFFALNETNYNSINLNNTRYLTSVREHIEEDDDTNIFDCKVKNSLNDKSLEKEVFLSEYLV